MGRVRPGTRMLLVAKHANTWVATDATTSGPGLARGSEQVAPSLSEAFAASSSAPPNWPGRPLRLRYARFLRESWQPHGREKHPRPRTLHPASRYFLVPRSGPSTETLSWGL